VDRASDSPALLSESARAHRGMASGVAAKLSLLVLMFILTTFPEPTDSGFAATREIILSKLFHLRVLYPESQPSGEWD